MSRSKYPGIQILYEVGTRQELAQSYGVSERTMYRWLNKAKAQTKERQQYPGAGPISRFKGTRKELASKYNISERTAYRWIKKARESGADIPSRQAKSRYPGTAILDEHGTNKSIGDRFGVSEATIRRWKNRARAEEEDYESFTSVNDLVEDIINLDKLSPDSAFLGLDKETQREYMYAYIKYQSQHNKDLYYWVEHVGMTDIPSEDIASLNIWGDSFETFVQEQIALDEYSEQWAR